MHELIRAATAELARFLLSKLPHLSDDWWQRHVVDRLSFQQQRMVQERNLQTLQQLDFACLLRVLDQNWYELSTAHGLPREGRNWVKELQTVRNKWAHLSAEEVPAIDLYRDADTLGRLLTALGIDTSLSKAIESVKDTALAALTGNKKNSFGARVEEQPSVTKPIASTFSGRAADLRRFYQLLDRLAAKTGELRELGDANGRMPWPDRGVYFFFEPGELRSGSGEGHRVVRVGTHGLKSGSQSTLWSRLAQHRGQAIGGNHRGSVFRLLIGLAIANRRPKLAIPSWGVGASATRQTIEQERELEIQVSVTLAKMQVLWLSIEDEPGPDSLRGVIERNSIALLSSFNSLAVDPASPEWLGFCCPRERVTKSGLWNSNHVDAVVEPAFLDSIEQLIEFRVPSATSVKTKREVTIANSPTRARGNADLIIAALGRSPDLDDDELAQHSGVSPRQQVNIICRRLEQNGLLKRFHGPRGKIVNRLIEVGQATAISAIIQLPRPTIKSQAQLTKPISTPTDHSICLGSKSDDTLIVIPCSGRKSTSLGPTEAGSLLLGELPKILADRLAEARKAVAGLAHLDESGLMPAWRRYNGALYQRARSAFEQMQETSWFQNVLILSGGYGIVRADDPIGTYDLALQESYWPPGLLQEVIEVYARQHKIRRVFAIVSETTGYARILRKVSWRDAGVSSALLITPEASTGAMLKTPRAIGEALVTIMANGLNASWKSSDGLGMFTRQIA